MNDIVHRSENLTISRGEGTSLIVDLRFPTSSARGVADSACPRCGANGTAEQWEMEGPDGRNNTIWFGCGANGCRVPTRWSRTVTFEEGWTENG